MIELLANRGPESIRSDNFTRRQDMAADDSRPVSGFNLRKTAKTPVRRGSRDLTYPAQSL